MLPVKSVLAILEIDDLDTHLFGEKAAELSKLKKAGFPVIDSFVITSKALHDFLKENDLETKIRHLLGAMESIEKAQNHIKKHVIEGQFPQNSVKEIFRFYKNLGGVLEHSIVDLHHSQNHNLPSHFNIEGEATLLHKIKEAWSLLFENADLSINPTLIVQKSIKSGKKGKIQTSQNFENLPKDLQKLAQNLKKFYYFPYEIEYVLEKDKVFLIKTRPLTPLSKTQVFKIISNSAWNAGF